MLMVLQVHSSEEGNETGYGANGQHGAGDDGRGSKGGGGVGDGYLRYILPREKKVLADLVQDQHEVLVIFTVMAVEVVLADVDHVSLVRGHGSTEE